MYRTSTLPNSLTVATVEMPHMCSVSVGLWVGVGSRYESPELNGVCHFIEHMLFKGTTRRSPREISEAVEGIGGYLNAYTSEEATCFHARAGAEYLPEVVDVLFDMLLHAKFQPSDIAKEREVIKDEIAMYLDEPQHQVQEILNSTVWRDQPLGRPITGTPESLDLMRRSELLAFLHRYYIPNRALLVAAGNVHHRTVVRAAIRQSVSMRAGAEPWFEPATSGQTQPQISLLTRRTEQTQVALGVRTCSRHDKRRFAMRLLNTILGENMSSRLFQAIREDRGLAYSIYSTPSFFADAGDLVVYAGMEVDNLEPTLKLIAKELTRLSAEGPSQDELERARDFVFGQIDLGLESTESQMNWVGEQLLGYRRIYPPSEVKRRLTRVQRSDLQACAREFFRPERLNLAMVSPLRKSPALMKSLARILYSVNA